MMNKNRRDFLRITGIAGIALSGAGILSACNTGDGQLPVSAAPGDESDGEDLSLIGPYGYWTAAQMESRLPRLSFRNEEYTNVESWSEEARRKLEDLVAVPDAGPVPEVRIDKQYSFEGLHVEELSWQLPYGRRTQAILLKPEHSTGPLPGILALHDHAMDKYHGKEKLVRISDKPDPLMEVHQKDYYSERAWANEIAKRGYAVLVPDGFAFASRRVKLEDVPPVIREGLSYKDSEKPENIKAYNDWASRHEHVMAKSLFSAGTTWPGMFLAEDIKALDILCSRQDVDTRQIGCCGLSGGGVRTLFLAAIDKRVKCAIPVGFMTTSKDLLLHKSFTHTWMAFAPLLGRELNFAEIISIRTPLPTLVLNNNEDALFTLSEMKEADRMLAEVYKKAGAPDHYKCSFHPGIHKFDKNMQEEAFDWFDRWLKA